MSSLKSHIRIAIGYFLIIGVLGLVLRMFSVVEVPINYRFIVHTHSHIALLGWVYTALTTLIYYTFLGDKSILKKYQRIFWLTQFTIVGMMLSFPFTGYALVSILFSTLFLVASYWFTYFFLKHVTLQNKQKNSFKLIRLALWYMILSSLGPWALGGIMTTLGSSSVWYRNAIYFFLHFQYNGWFIVALCGFLFVIFEKYKLVFSKKEFQWFFWLLSAGVVLTFFLSVLWMKPNPLFYVLAGLGSILQLIAFGILIRRISIQRVKLKDVPKTVAILLKISALFLFVKLIAQFIGSFPKSAQIIASNIDFVVGYIHWTFLGVVSLALLAFLFYFKCINLSRRTYLIYLTGFLFMEALIFYKGMISWLGGSLINPYHQLLTLSSVVLVVAISMLFINQMRSLNENNGSN